MTLSRKRTPRWMARLREIQSTSPSLANRERLMCPRLQTPQAGKLCSAQGLVAINLLKYHELLYAFMRSINTTPGSADIYADLMIVSHITQALTVVYIFTGFLSSSRQYLISPSHKRSSS